MSLISEALRKARQEAFEAREPERTARFTGMVSRSTGRSRSRTVPVLVVAVCAACLGAAGAWWGFHGSGPTVTAEAGGHGPAAVAAAAPTVTPTVTPTSTAAATSSSTAEAAAVAGPTSTPSSAAPQPTPPPSEPSSEQPEAAHDEATPTPTATVRAHPSAAPTQAPLVKVTDVSGEGNVTLHRPGRERPTPTAHVRPTPTARVRPTPSSDAERRPGATARPREFDVTARIGHVTLELDYLVYRAKDPFAQINGQEVHVGSEIEGFVVKEITRDYVRLHDAKGDLLLRVH